MSEVTITREQFVINGKEELFLCGEIHYFRMKKQYWEKALDALLESGCQAVAYYIPWFIHEYEEGKFDFTGEICPENDLREWLRLTQKKGLLGFVRPGPYIYAETTDLGLPKWFSSKYRNAHVKGYRDGCYVDVGMENNVSHNHPDFIRAVARWYQAVCRELSGYFAPQGNIVLFQLCNEIPTEDLDDRNPENLGIGKPDGLYPRFLEQKYGTAEELGRHYHTSFTSLLFVEPHMLEKANPALAKNDQLEFVYHFYFPAYFQKLERIAREQGVTVPMVHNAYNPRAISLHCENNRLNPWLSIGVDCYYSLTGRLGMREGTYFCEYGAEYSAGFLQKAPWVVEHECGYWKDEPAVYGMELYLWNIWAIAAGYRGLNFYLFAGAENRPGMGWYGTDHNWQAPVDCRGEKQESFADIARSIREIRKNQRQLTMPARHDIQLGVSRSPGLIWKRGARASDDFFYLLRCAGFTPKVCDYENEAVEISDDMPLCVVCDGVMEAPVQERLLQYVRKGGTLILWGRVPTKDLMERECRLLADGLDIQAESCEDCTDDQQKMTLDGIEYYIGRTVQPVESGNGEILAVENHLKKPAAIKTMLGRGKVLLLPFTAEIAFYSQAEGLRKLLEKAEVFPYLKNLKRLRVIPKADGSAVALNPHPVKTTETFCLGERAVTVSLEPYEYAIV